MHLGSQARKRLVGVRLKVGDDARVEPRSGARLGVAGGAFRVDRAEGGVVRAGPSIAEPIGEVPVVEGDVGGDFRVAELVEEGVVKRVALLDGGAIGAHQARPREREAIMLHPRARHEADVGGAVLVVADAGARVLAEIPPVREIVPRGTGAIAAVALDLERARGDAKDELGGKEVVVANLERGGRAERGGGTRRATATRGRGRA